MLCCFLTKLPFKGLGATAGKDQAVAFDTVWGSPGRGGQPDALLAYAPKTGKLGYLQTIHFRYQKNNAPGLISRGVFLLHFYFTYVKRNAIFCYRLNCACVISQCTIIQCLCGFFSV